MSPETFLRVLDPQPFSVAYAQPSRRPADGRYGENPNRLFKHTQFQVVLKPPPVNAVDLGLWNPSPPSASTCASTTLSLKKTTGKLRTLGPGGIGWQVMLDGLEITQFTYFQQCGGLDLDPISAEITYGLERIAAFLQDVDSLYDVVWARTPHPVTYGEVRHLEEVQFSVYNRGGRMWRSSGSICASMRRNASIWLSQAAQQPEELTPRREAAPLSCAGCLRPLPQVLAPLQSARCARRNLGDRARRHHRPHPRPRRRHRQGLLAHDHNYLAHDCAAKRSIGLVCLSCYWKSAWKRSRRV